MKRKSKTLSKLDPFLDDSTLPWLQRQVRPKLPLNPGVYKPPSNMNNKSNRKLWYAVGLSASLILLAFFCFVFFHLSEAGLIAIVSLTPWIFGAFVGGNTGEKFAKKPEVKE